jgi:hypothetical protein
MPSHPTSDPEIVMAHRCHQDEAAIHKRLRPNEGQGARPTADGRSDEATVKLNEASTAMARLVRS